MQEMITAGAYILIAAMSGVISARAYRLYRASDHTGIRYFWLAFLAFGIAMLARGADMLTEGFWWASVLTIIFRYAAIAGLLSLVYSMQWRDFPKSRDWLRHAAAAATTVLSLWQPIVFAATALLIVLYGLQQSYFHHQERGTHGLQLYVIAFSLATIAVLLLALLSALPSKTLEAYSLLILTILFGIVLVGATQVGRDA